MSRSMNTLFDADGALRRLGPRKVADFAADVLRCLFMEEPGEWNPDKPWDAEVLDELGSVVDAYKLRPPQQEEEW